LERYRQIKDEVGGGGGGGGGEKKNKEHCTRMLVKSYQNMLRNNPEEQRLIYNAAEV